jgi:putative SOS response-associated peptidase YedK
LCEQFSLTTDLSEIVNYFQVNKVAGSYEQRQSVTPRQQTYAIAYLNGERCLKLFRWGLMPFWAQDSVTTDCDYVFEKKAFHRISTKNRCVIPCNAFYESKMNGKLKEIVRFAMRKKQLFGFAGIYDIWITPRGERIYTCSLITTRPNRLVDEYRDRMPVILEEKAIDPWLNKQLTDKYYLHTLLNTFDPEEMEMNSVIQPGNDSKKVEYNDETLWSGDLLLKP